MHRIDPVKITVGACERGRIKPLQVVLNEMSVSNVLALELNRIPNCFLCDTNGAQIAI